MIKEERKKLNQSEKNKIGVKCANCESVEGLEYHHIIPLSIGGSNLLSNYVCLCYKCHALIHGRKKAINLSEATKAGIQKARERGVQIGRKAGDTYETKKSIQSKELIKELNYDFNGTLSNEETYKKIGISRNSFYKYKKEMLEELKK
jgi:hypothetical protein